MTSIPSKVGLSSNLQHGQGSKPTWQFLLGLITTQSFQHFKRTSVLSKLQEGSDENTQGRGSHSFLNDKISKIFHNFSLTLHKIFITTNYKYRIFILKRHVNLNQLHYGTIIAYLTFTIQTQSLCWSKIKGTAIKINSMGRGSQPGLFCSQTLSIVGDPR